MLDIFSLKKGAILKLVYGCNHHCSFCHERDNIFSYDFTSIRLEDLSEIRLWLIANGFDYVILSGGECSLHPDLGKIIEFFQKEFYVVVISNGSHIQKHDLSGLQKNITFYFSFHGLEEVYADITESSDFHKLLESIKSTASYGYTIILRCVVNQRNISQIDEICNFVYTNFPENVYIELVLLEDLKYSHVSGVAISLQQYISIVIRQLTSTHRKRFLFDGGPLCLHPILTKYGKYFADPLTNTMVGLVKKHKNTKLNFDIKTGVSHTNIKALLEKCKTCTLYKNCHGADARYFDSDSIGKK